MNKPNHYSTSPIEKSVMTRIKTGQTKMHPKSYFIFLSTLLISAITLLGFVASYFVSIAIFWIKVQSASGPAYGARQNLAEMIESFPIWQTFIGAALLVIVIILVNKVGKIYKIRLMYLIPLIISIILLTGIAISYTSLPNVFNGQYRNNRGQNSSYNHNSIN